MSQCLPLAMQNRVSGSSVETGLGAPNVVFGSEKLACSLTHLLPIKRRVCFGVVMPLWLFGAGRGLKRFLEWENVRVYLYL